MIRKAGKYRFVLIGGVAGLFVVTVLAFTARFSASSLFQSVVTRPIPNSVRRIKADRRSDASFLDRFSGFEQHTYILRFEISKEDTSQILTSDEYTRLGYIEYVDGALKYGLTDRVRGGFMLYETKREEPGWFDLEEWRDFEAYIVEQELQSSWYKAHVLLYDEQLSKAYFFEHEVRGTWGGILSVTDPRAGELPQWVQQQMEQAHKERFGDANGSVGIWED